MCLKIFLQNSGCAFAFSLVIDDVIMRFNAVLLLKSGHTNEIKWLHPKAHMYAAFCCCQKWEFLRSETERIVFYERVVPWQVLVRWGWGVGGEWKLETFLCVAKPRAYKTKTLNHPVYLRMCVMQKMPFTAWTESGCVAGRLKSSLPRATEKVSVQLKLV